MYYWNMPTRFLISSSAIFKSFSSFIEYPTLHTVIFFINWTRIEIIMHRLPEKCECLKMSHFSRMVQICSQQSRSPSIMNSDDFYVIQLSISCLSLDYRVYGRAKPSCPTAGLVGLSQTTVVAL